MARRKDRVIGASMYETAGAYMVLPHADTAQPPGVPAGFEPRPRPTLQAQQALIPASTKPAPHAHPGR